MFNVTVINIKKSMKSITIILMLLMTILIISKCMNKIQKSEIMQMNISEKLINSINKEIPAMASTYEKSIENIKNENEQDDQEGIMSKLLSIELSKIQNIPEKTEQVIQEGNIETAEIKTPQVTEENANTEIVTQNPITESYNTEINGVKIKNETEFEINQSIMDNSLEIDKNNILIFHTHTCESYTPSESNDYEQTGNFRTTDSNYNVVKVGEDLKNYLEQKEFNVIHDGTFHDYPAYTGSYTRSKATVEKLLEKNKSDIIIDLHRDAIGSKSNYDPSVKIGGYVASQLMFVIGTNGGGLYHPDWKSNLEFAIKVQEKANELYPGLFKPIIVRNSRYNQHLGRAACIIEVGSTGNTLEQSEISMKYLAKVFEEFRK